MSDKTRPGVLIFNTKGRLTKRLSHKKLFKRKIWRDFAKPMMGRFKYLWKGTKIEINESYQVALVAGGAFVFNKDVDITNDIKEMRIQLANFIVDNEKISEDTASTGDWDY